MIKNKVTVLTVVPYEEPPRGEDELTDLLENATSLISAIKDLTKNVKDMIEQKTSHIEPPPARTYPPKPAGSSYNEYKPRRKPPCLIDYSKDVSVRYKSKDDTNVHAKGRVPAGSFGATNSLKQAFDRRKWILANPPEINKHVPQKKQQPVNKPKVPQTVIKEKAIQAEVPYESKYVQNTPEIANKPKKEAPKEVPVEPQNVTELVDVMVKNISGSSSDSLSSQVISPAINTVLVRTLLLNKRSN